MFSALANNVILGWIGRRVPEVFGLIMIVVSSYNALPLMHQETIIAVLTGRGGGLTVTALLGLVSYVWAQVMSYRATVKPQVVTPGGEKLAMPKRAAETARVEQIAKATPRSQTMLERLLARRQ